MKMLLSVWELIKYWHFRYLIATEMYMVERWEKATIYIILSVLFIGCWYFNTSVVVGLVGQFTPSLQKPLNSLTDIPINT